MESVDYPDFLKTVKQRVSQKMAFKQSNFAFVVQDVEDYLLSIGKTFNKLNRVERYALEGEIRRRLNHEMD